MPPSIISLLLPYLDLNSLMHLELTCHQLEEIIKTSGEYIRRYRRLKGGLLQELEQSNSLYCKQQLIKRNVLMKKKVFLSDHRVSQNLSFARSASLRKGLLLLLLLITKAVKFAPESSNQILF